MSKQLNTFTAREILKVMSLQTFSDFYEGHFMDYIEGQEGRLSEEEVISELDELLSRFKPRSLKSKPNEQQNRR